MKQVLVAAADAAVRARIDETLTDAGHDVREAQTAPELLAQLAASRTQLDVILLDLTLSHHTGVDLARAVRQVDAGRIPLVVFSGSVATAADARALAQLGVVGYLNEHATAQALVQALAPHLFPNSLNRRSGPRLSLGMPVELRHGAVVHGATSANISHGGMAVRVSDPPEPTTRVQLHFRLPGTSTPIAADARVVWNDRRTVCGLQFEQVAPDAQRLIDALVESRVGDEAAG